MSKKISTKLIIKNDSADEWSKNNPILDKCEFGIDTTSGKLKVGDGTSTFIDLPSLSLDDSNYAKLDSVNRFTDTSSGNTFYPNTAMIQGNRAAVIGSAATDYTMMMSNYIIARKLDSESGIYATRIYPEKIRHQTASGAVDFTYDTTGGVLATQEWANEQGFIKDESLSFTEWTEGLITNQTDLSGATIYFDTTRNWDTDSWLLGQTVFTTSGGYMLCIEQGPPTINLYKDCGILNTIYSYPSTWLESLTLPEDFGYITSFTYGGGELEACSFLNLITTNVDVETTLNKDLSVYGYATQSWVTKNAEKSYVTTSDATLSVELTYDSDGNIKWRGNDVVPGSSANEAQSAAIGGVRYDYVGYNYFNIPSSLDAYNNGIYQSWDVIEILDTRDDGTPGNIKIKNPTTGEEVTSYFDSSLGMYVIDLEVCGGCPLVVEHVGFGDIDPKSIPQWRFTIKHVAIDLPNNVLIEIPSHPCADRTPTSAEGNQAFAYGGSSHAYGDWSFAGGKDAKAYQRASFTLGGGGTQAGMTEEEFNTRWAGNTDENGNIVDRWGSTYDKSYSFATALGSNTKALGRNDFVFGDYCSSEGEAALVGGYHATSKSGKHFSLTLGHEVTTNGALNINLGESNTVTGDRNVAIGNNISITGNESFGIGSEINISLDKRIVLGSNSNDYFIELKGGSSINKGLSVGGFVQNSDGVLDYNGGIHAYDMWLGNKNNNTYSRLRLNNWWMQKGSSTYTSVEPAKIILATATDTYAIMSSDSLSLTNTGHTSRVTTDYITVRQIPTTSTDVTRLGDMPKEHFLQLRGSADYNVTANACVSVFSPSTVAFELFDLNSYLQARIDTFVNAVQINPISTPLYPASGQFYLYEDPNSDTGRQDVIGQYQVIGITVTTDAGTVLVGVPTSNSSATVTHYFCPIGAVSSDHINSCSHSY